MGKHDTSHNNCSSTGLLGSVCVNCYCKSVYSQYTLLNTIIKMSIFYWRISGNSIGIWHTTLVVWVIIILRIPYVIPIIV